MVTVTKSTKKSKFSFRVIESVNNPRSIHWIYPYRWKISALDAQQLIEQLPKWKHLLDPFCWSWTITFESKRAWLISHWVDLNPIAIDIAKWKNSVSFDTDYVAETESLIESCKNISQWKVAVMPEKALKHFHLDTADEIMRVNSLVDSMPSYIKSAYYWAIALSARWCNFYKRTSSTVWKDIVPKQYICFYEKLLNKVKKHYYPLADNWSKVYWCDARNLSSVIQTNSIDYVFTSPPYFDCLDYTAYYARIIYNINNIDVSTMKSNLIQKYKTYKDDMKKVLNELDVVCKKWAKIIFVVWDKKIHWKLINWAEFFNEISPFWKWEVVERIYTWSSSQIFDKLNNTKRREQIVIWEK